MSAFAISWLGLARSRRATAALPCGLAFDRPGGPLVAVCGLAGGAGTSTLALALARRAARESAACVLLCEADSRAGGLAAAAGVRSALSLGELAAAALGGRPIQGAPFALVDGGLRLIAGAPGSARGEGDQVRALLVEARAAHGVVVVDGGALGNAGAPAALAAATQALLVMPATGPGLRRAEQLLASELAPRHGATLVAVAPAGQSLRPRALRQLAERHVERLVLVPHIPALARGEEGAGELELALAALATVLRRPA